MPPSGSKLVYGHTASSLFKMMIQSSYPKAVPISGCSDASDMTCKLNNYGYKQ